MRRDEGLEPMIGSWMERNAVPAADDLLPRVMREVDSMSQRTRTWPSALAAVHVGWAAAAAVVVVLAVGIGLLVYSSGGRPIGGPNPSATPTVTSSPSPTPIPSFAPPASATEAIDGVIATWNQRDVAQLYHYYAPGATVRIANGATDFTENYVGLPAVSDTLRSSGRAGCTITRTGDFIHQGSTWANPFRYACADGSIAGFAIFRLGADNRVISHWAILRMAGAMVGPVTNPANVVAFFDGCDAATNREDYATLDGCYAASADHRASVADPSGRWNETAIGIGEIRDFHAGGASIDFRLHRTGSVLQVGDLVAYPVQFTQTGGGGDGVTVFRLNGERTQILNEWVFAD